MINKILKFLTFDKFFIGKQKDILIFDERNSNFLSEYFENDKFNFFYSRKEKFEIYVFFLTIIKNGTKNFGKNYFFNYLKVYKPKYIFSMWVLNDYLFYVKNFMVTHESRIWQRENEPLTVNPQEIMVPDYYADIPEVRNDIARKYSNIEEMLNQSLKSEEE